MIPIILAADHNYKIPLKVTIGSALCTADSGTQYRFYILTDQLFCSDELEDLKTKFSNFEVVLHQIDLEKLNYKINNEGLSAFTFCRLFLSEIFTECEKCIYIDTDTIIIDDLSSLYNRNIEECYVSGVKDYGLQMYAKRNKKGHSDFSLSEMETYINAGVLLMNLKKIRQDGLSSLFKQNITKLWEYEDQDIINKCCKGAKTFLGVRYNVLYRYYKRMKFIENGFYPLDDVQQAQDCPAIIHYTGRDMKPWKCIRTRAAKEWWNYAKQVLSINEYTHIYNNAHEMDKMQQWEYMLIKCKNERVVIWGYSDIGRQLFRWFRIAGVDVAFFCDNKEAKQGDSNGVEVKSLQQAVAEKVVMDYVFVIASQRHFEAIRKQLIQFGIQKIERFFYKNKFYYMALDESYYDIELEEIRVKEGFESMNLMQKVSSKYWLDLWWKNEDIG